MCLNKKVGVGVGVRIWVTVTVGPRFSVGIRVRRDERGCLLNWEASELQLLTDGYSTAI